MFRDSNSIRFGAGAMRARLPLLLVGLLTVLAAIAVGCSSDPEAPTPVPPTTVTSVASTDINKIEVNFSGRVSASAEADSNYSVVEAAPSPTGGVTFAASTTEFGSYGMNLRIAPE